ncbi:MAG TPA: histidinol-phosphate transaminase [Nitrososphaeraceae archaeon]
MTNWFIDKIEKISQIEKYHRPLEVRLAKLDANENLVLDNTFLIKFIQNIAKETDLRRYPISLYDDLYKKLGIYLKISASNIVLGNGSDQIIDLILATVGKNKKVSIFAPTFSYFQSRCKLHGIKIIQTPLRQSDNTFDKSEFLKNTSESQLAYICSPNNPTSNQFDQSLIHEILCKMNNTLVILDEAYVEFGKYSMIRYAERYPNLIILRTFSKAFGLAGARVGYMISSKKISRIFRENIQSPYPINSLSLAISIYTLSNIKFVLRSIRIIKEERRKLFHHLSKLKGIKTYESDANFIFVVFKRKYNRILRSLKDFQIVVKPFNNISGYGKCMRISISSPEINNNIIRVFNQELASL